MVRRWCALGVAVAMAAGAVACSGGGGEAAPPSTEAPSSTTSTAPPPPVVSDEQAVLAAYRGYWDTWLAANDPPNPDHPDLAKYATGAALEKVTESVRQHRQLRQVVRLPEGSVWRHDVRIAELGPRMAEVTDCTVDDSMLVDQPSGQVLNDQIATIKTTALLVLADGSWRVSAVTAEQQWGGVAGCAA